MRYFALPSRDPGGCPTQVRPEEDGWVRKCGEAHLGASLGSDLGTQEVGPQRRVILSPNTEKDGLILSSQLKIDSAHIGSVQ